MSENPSLQRHINISEGVAEDSIRHSPSRSPSPIKSKSIQNDHSTKSPFVTGTNIVGKNDKAARVNEVYDYHDKLNGLIDVLDNKVKVLLNENQNNFLLAYKEQMTHVQKELKSLKKKLDEETNKRKSDERMNILEQERDYFKVEALRLDQVCKEQQRVIQDLKFKLKLTNDDKNYYEEYVLTAKKENKALKEELSQLDSRKTVGELPPLDLHSRLLGSLGSSSKKGKSIDLKNAFTPRKKQNGENAQAEHTPAILLGQDNFHSEHNCPKEKELSEIIQQVKGELDRERKLNRQLRQEKSQFITSKTQLEQILAQSINEVKKEISNRKNSRKTSKDLQQDSKFPIDVDISKFTSIDKKNVIEYFLSNTTVLEEVYNLVFGHGEGKRESFIGEKSNNFNLNINKINNLTPATKSEGKLKYSFNYGFGTPANMKLTPKELDNVTISKRSQNLLEEIKRLNGRRGELMKRDL